jgi:hypothetical protein
MNPIYAFHTLDPRPSAANPILDTPCLGIEVTTEALAARCSLGNIDPQHGHQRAPLCDAYADGHTLAESPMHGGPCGHGGAVGYWPEPERNDTAISYALRFSPLPPSGAALVTVRPDVDAIGAMAVIVLRTLGMLPDGRLDDVARDIARSQNMPLLAESELLALSDRVSIVAQRDAFTPGAEWMPRPLPTVAQPWPTTAAPVEETQSLAPLGVICSPMRQQTQLPMAARVAVVACWLLWGAPDEDEEGWIRDDARRIAQACGVDAECRGNGWTAPGGSPHEEGHHFRALYLSAERTALDARLDLARAVESGEIRITPVGAQGHYSHGIGMDVIVDPPTPPTIAVVESAHRGAMGLGYCVAPVVVAAMSPDRPSDYTEKRGPEEWPRKMTISAWQPGLVDFSALRAALNAAESALIVRTHGCLPADATFDAPLLDHDQPDNRVAWVDRPDLSGRKIARRMAAGGGHLIEESTVLDEVRWPERRVMYRRIPLPTWGGGATILGSPQGTGSMLSLADVVRLVREHPL